MSVHAWRTCGGLPDDRDRPHIGVAKHVRGRRADHARTRTARGGFCCDVAALVSASRHTHAFVFLYETKRACHHSALPAIIL